MSSSDTLSYRYELSHDQDRYKYHNRHHNRCADLRTVYKQAIYVYSTAVTVYSHLRLNVAMYSAISYRALQVFFCYLILAAQLLPPATR
jgi:hypothetical protein